MGFHFLEQSRQNRSIDPPNIPFLIVFYTQSEIGLLRTILHDIVILTVSDIDHQGPFTHIFFVSISSLVDKVPARVVQNVELVSVVGMVRSRLVRNLELVEFRVHTLHF